MKSEDSEIPKTEKELEPSGEEKIPVVSDQDFEKAFKQKYPVLWLSSLIGPGAIALLIIVVYYMVFGADEIRNLAFAVVVTFLALGRFVILIGGEEYTSFGMVFEMSV